MMESQRFRAQEEHHVSANRRAETRTKIQLGGLIIKSGLADILGIKLGDDLQQYDDHLEKVAVILGALMEAVIDLPDYREAWAFKGRQHLKYEFMLQKQKETDE